MMLNPLPNYNDYYDAWDLHMVEMMTDRYGYQGAVARCIEKKWSDLEQLLRATFSERYPQIKLH